MKHRSSPRERAQAFIRFALGLDDDVADGSALAESFADWTRGQTRRGMPVRPLERQAIALEVRRLLGGEAALAPEVEGAPYEASA